MVSNKLQGWGSNRSAMARADDLGPVTRGHWTSRLKRSSESHTLQVFRCDVGGFLSAHFASRIGQKEPRQGLDFAPTFAQWRQGLPKEACDYPTQKEAHGRLQGIRRENGERCLWPPGRSRRSWPGGDVFSSLVRPPEPFAARGTPPVGQ